VFARESRLRPLAAPPGDHPDERSKCGGIDQEQDPGARGRKDRPTDRWPDSPGKVLVDGTKRDRLDPFIRVDQFGLKGLPGRGSERLTYPYTEYKGKERPRRDKF
jgi:hypothetical protein